MQAAKILDHQTIDRKVWEHFVDRQPGSSAFHTPSMVDLFTGVPGHRVSSFFMVHGDELVGLFILYHHQNGPFPFNRLTARGISWAGPLVRDRDPDLLDQLMASVSNKRDIYTEIRSINDLQWAMDGLKKAGFVYDSHYDIFNDISDLDAAWGKLKANRRNSVRRSIKRGLEAEVKREVSVAEAEDCYHILKKRYREIKHPVPSRDFILGIQDHLVRGGQLVAVLTRVEGRIVGFLWALTHKEQVFDWYMAFDSVHADKFVTDRLVWEIMKWGGENGYKVFDFGGGGKPNVPYGVRQFKLQFGGELVESGRLRMVHRPALMKLGESGLKLYKKAKLISKLTK